MPCESKEGCGGLRSDLAISNHGFVDIRIDVVKLLIRDLV